MNSAAPVGYALAMSVGTYLQTCVGAEGRLGHRLQSQRTRPLCCTNLYRLPAVPKQNWISATNAAAGPLGPLSRFTPRSTCHKRVESWRRTTSRHRLCTDTRLCFRPPPLFSLPPPPPPPPTAATSPPPSPSKPRATAHICTARHAARSRAACCAVSRRWSERSARASHILRKAEW